MAGFHSNKPKLFLLVWRKLNSFQSLSFCILKSHHKECFHTFTLWRRNKFWQHQRLHCLPQYGSNIHNKYNKISRLIFHFSNAHILIHMYILCMYMYYYTHLLYTILRSLHSKKEDILGFLAKIVDINSRVIFFFNLSGCASYHFCRRNFPCRLNNSINCIYNIENQMKFQIKEDQWQNEQDYKENWHITTYV